MNYLFQPLLKNFLNQQIYQCPQHLIFVRSAAPLIESGDFALVSDVEPITQPVYVAMHLRHRPQRMHKRLTKTVIKVFAAQ